MDEQCCHNLSTVKQDGALPAPAPTTRHFTSDQQADLANRMLLPYTVPAYPRCSGAGAAEAYAGANATVVWPRESRYRKLRRGFASFLRTRPHEELLMKRSLSDTVMHCSISLRSPHCAGSSESPVV